MQSPPAELAVDIAGGLVKNLLRAQGEADYDTLSEQLRGIAERLPHGRRVVYGAILLAAVVFAEHIDRPLR